MPPQTLNGSFIFVSETIQKNPDPFKGKRGKRGLKIFRYRYTDIAKLLGVNVATAKAYAHRGLYDPNDLQSIARFWATRRLS